jgi:ABC-type transporter Mla subunit MlaD
MQLVSAGITGRALSPDRLLPPRALSGADAAVRAAVELHPSAPSTLKSVGDTATDVLNRLPELETRISDTLGTMNTTLGSIDRFVTELGSQNGSFDRLLVQLRMTTVSLGARVDEAKLADTTGAVRTAANNVSSAANGFSELREDLQSSLAALRETLDSVRTVADSLERDPSMLLRGPRPDAPAPVPPQGKK